MKINEPQNVSHNIEKEYALSIMGKKNGVFSTLYTGTKDAGICLQ